MNDTLWFAVIFAGATVLAVPIYYFMRNSRGNVPSLLRRMGAVDAPPGGASAQELDRFALDYDLKDRPELLVISSPAANAFALGTDPRTGALLVTTGLEQLLDRDQLRAVLASLVMHLTGASGPSLLTSGIEGVDTSVRHASEHSADKWTAAVTEDPASQIGALRCLGGATTAMPDWQTPGSAFGNPSVWAYVSLIEGADSIPRRIARLERDASSGGAGDQTA